MRGFEAYVPSNRLRQKARYEIAVAELRGRGNLDPARNLVEAFFEALPKEDPRAVELLDGAVLCVYGWGAVLQKQTTIEVEQVQAWGREVADLVDAALGARRAAARSALCSRRRRCWPA